MGCPQSGVLKLPLGSPSLAVHQFGCGSARIWGVNHADLRHLSFLTCSFQERQLLLLVFKYLPLRCSYLGVFSSVAAGYSLALFCESWRSGNFHPDPPGYITSHLPWALGAPCPLCLFLQPSSFCNFLFLKELMCQLKYLLVSNIIQYHSVTQMSADCQVRASVAIYVST